MISIAPSILSADFAALAEAIAAVEAAGASRLHLDVMDGHFVPNLTIGPAVVRAIRPRTRLLFEAHLMVEEPRRFLKAFRDAGTDLILIHREVCSDVRGICDEIRSLGARAGVTLKPETPVAAVADELDALDQLLVMTVEPGFGGQSLMPAEIAKVTEAASLIKERGLRVPIEVDGGINAETAGSVVRAGAEILVAGHAIFHHPRGAAAAVKGLLEAAAAACGGV